MKPLILSLIFTAIFGSIFSQRLQKPENSEVPESAKNSNLVFTKAYGDIIWAEDFSSEKWSGTAINASFRDKYYDTLGYIFDTTSLLPQGWNFVDSTHLNYFWHWSDVGPRGQYTSFTEGWYTPNNEFLSTIPAPNSINNGFVMLESDYFHSNPDSGVVPDSIYNILSYIEYGPIDMSSYQGVMFNCKLYYRLCCDAEKSVDLQVSVDFNPSKSSGTWETFKLNKNNTSASYSPADRDPVINLSSLAAGHDSVYFRIRNHMASHYFVLVDDINFYEPPSHNLEIKDAWADYLYDASNGAYTLPIKPINNAYNFFGGYTQIPASLIGSFVKFRAAATNFATETATNSQLHVKIFKDSVLDFEGGTSGKNIQSYASDTLLLETNYTPPGMGNYQVSLTITQNASDEIPENNGWEYLFKVSENTYSRVTPGGESNYTTAGPRDFVSGGFDGDVCAQMFDFPETDDDISLKGASVYFSAPFSINEETAIKNGEFAMYAKIYTIDGNGQIAYSGISSDLYTLTIEDTSSWVNLNFINDNNLKIPGNQSILLGIETYTGASDQSLRFHIGNDTNGPKQPAKGGLIFFSSQPGWYLSGKNYAINLIINDSIPMVNVTFNASDINCLTQLGMFDPAEDTLYVAGSFNNWITPGDSGSVTLIDSGIDGIYTATIQLQANSGDIQYKYFINSGWTGGEWDGEPNRNATIADKDVILDDIISLCDANHQTSFLTIEIYPNPTRQSATIKGFTLGSTLTVSNVLGQMLIQKESKQTTMELNLSDYKNGLYFITIYDTNGYSLTKTILKY